jgi:SpoVK/Ycf46/Vps4 family AAA+-type ATPase
VLERADADGPTVVLLDEFEQIASRDGDDGTATMTNTVLQLTDGADAVSDVVLIGATNRRAVCDPAIFSRFDAVEFPLPSPEARVAILEGFLEGGGVTAAVSAEELGRLDLSGYSGRDVRELAGWAFTLANQDGDGDALTVTADHVAGGKRLFERRRGGTDDGSSDPR